MTYKELGKTGLKVSQLCFGSLTISPLQKDFLPAKAGCIIKNAIAQGINFVDTAELYQNYEHIKSGINDCKNSIILSSKSYAYTYDDMKLSIEKACREVGRDYIDIFSLHEQSSRLTLKGHQDALMCLVDAKQKGLIRAIGVSTHYIEVVRAASMIDEVDVIHPIINKSGLGIADGNKEDMLKAIEFAHYMGKGIYAMKALGGGHLAQDSEESLRWVLSLPCITSIAVGMHSIDEISANIAIFSGNKVAQDVVERLKNIKRYIYVESYCEGCGRCEEHCSIKAIKIIDGKAVISIDKCIRCGYCAAYCPHFCIKVV